MSYSTDWLVLILWTRGNNQNEIIIWASFNFDWKVKSTLIFLTLIRIHSFKFAKNISPWLCCLGLVVVSEDSDPAGWHGLFSEARKLNYFLSFGFLTHYDLRIMSGHHTRHQGDQSRRRRQRGNKKLFHQPPKLQPLTNWVPPPVNDDLTPSMKTF